VVAALTASYFVTSSVTSASYAATASSADSFLVRANTILGNDSIDTVQITGSMFQSGSYTISTGSITVSLGRISATSYTGSSYTGSFTGSVLLQNLVNASTANALYYNTSTGQVTYATPGASAAFPYTGSAQITGSLGVTGSVSVSGSMSVSGSSQITGSLVVTGNASVGSLTETSTLKLKTDISPIGEQVQKITQLNPVTYKWIDPERGREREYGFIAEEVSKIYPELVKYDENGDPEAIYYSKVVSVLVKAVQELKHEIEEIKKKCNVG
jgi:hypothetical protein